jgi:hypothetical protein
MTLRPLQCAILHRLLYARAGHAQTLDARACPPLFFVPDHATTCAPAQRTAVRQAYASIDFQPWIRSLSGISKRK